MGTCERKGAQEGLLPVLSLTATDRRVDERVITHGSVIRDHNGLMAQAARFRIVCVRSEGLFLPMFRGHKA